MGLRETKVARTRTQIVDVAVELFLENGYDGTTMEDIAERAEVGTTTLYRYFPTKDLILLEPFGDQEALTDVIRNRPADEPIDSVLGHAVLAAFEKLEHDQPRINAIRTVIDQSPVPRARLWDVLGRNRDQLEQAIGERIGEPPTLVHVQMAALTTQLTMGLSADIWRSSDGTRQLTEVARSVLSELAARPTIVPRAEP